MIRLDDQVFIITGGNGGIGLGMAEGIAMAGGRVAVWGRNTDKNAAALEQLDAEALFEVLESAAHRRLRHIEAIGGGGQAAGVDDGREGAEFFEAVHIGGIVLVWRIEGSLWDCLSLFGGRAFSCCN